MLLLLLRHITHRTQADSPRLVLHQGMGAHLNYIGVDSEHPLAIWTPICQLFRMAEGSARVAILPLTPAISEAFLANASIVSSNKKNRKKEANNPRAPHDSQAMARRSGLRDLLPF